MAENYVARQETGWIVVSSSPDVCKTPMGSSTPPVPYPVIAKLETSAGIAASVKANGYPMVVFDMSQTPNTLGDTAGSAAGVKSGTVGGKCYPKSHSSTVRAEGKLLIRHDDEFWMNGA